MKQFQISYNITKEGYEGYIMPTLGFPDKFTIELERGEEFIYKVNLTMEEIQAEYNLTNADLQNMEVSEYIPSGQIGSAFAFWEGHHDWSDMNCKYDESFKSLEDVIKFFESKGYKLVNQPIKGGA